MNKYKDFKWFKAATHCGVKRETSAVNCTKWKEVCCGDLSSPST